MPAASSLSPDASTLEHMPHLVRKICELWGKDEFEQNVNQVIMDSRDGRRLGLPPDAVEDLLFLVELTIAKRALHAAESAGIPFRQAFNAYLEKSQKFALYKAEDNADPWSTARDRQDAGRASRVNQSAPSVKRARTQKKKSWWRRLVG